ncbi:2-Hydroxyacid oxidase 1 [Diorhabda sublineata]|uniref:2-Hydroxyacid oxidase 1 n=1 Tax=Diorhabda sublineata TaxID=1163346 RepID=UPI0024E149E6|nr:2-Hydroxyacid oxidase 1 [Diorhabda sublineata]XP_056646032.1 2-Hydroxyacid oxidase 1 [Diorhabda sublineata]XP_056646042.1 2-Hydroxyacid oxidase 1 [Diorhabda sublineata]
MSDLVSVLDFEKYAFNNLPKKTLDYYRSGAGKQQTLAENREAFYKYKIRPRCLRNVENVDLSTTILGEKISMPIGIAPTAMQKMAHPLGECANARAAQELGTIFTLSTLSTSSIEEVAEAAPQAIKWYQLYIYKDRNITRDLVIRAEKAGFKALVLTVDAPVFGLRLEDLRNKFTLPSHLRLANFQGIKSGMNTERDHESGLNNYVTSLFDSSINWEDLKWLKSITKLPIVLKGILTAEDALLGVQAGVAAIQVSNHGARQIDGTVAAIDALPEIVKAVGDKIEVYMDGGVTDGVDILKAVALGARLVFIGRPALWGLTHSGQAGVEQILNILKKELITCMAIAGFSNIKEIDRNLVVHENYYSKL